MNISKEHVIKSNFDSWANFALYIEKNTNIIICYLILLTILLFIFIISKNLRISNNKCFFSDCNLSDFLIKLILNYYNSNHKINGFDYKVLFSKNLMDKKSISNCINYIKMQISEQKKLLINDYKFFDDTPNINVLNIDYNSYRTLLFVVQQYNSSIIFKEKESSLFFKNNKYLINHFNKILDIYLDITTCNKKQLLKLIEADFNFEDFELFLRLSIFLYALHLKL